ACRIKHAKTAVAGPGLQNTRVLAATLATTPRSGQTVSATTTATFRRSTGWTQETTKPCTGHRAVVATSASGPRESPRTWPWTTTTPTAPGSRDAGSASAASSAPAATTTFSGTAGTLSKCSSGRSIT